MPTEEVTYNFRILGYPDDDGGWAAHCLETDIVGFGEDFDAALKDLMELTEMQVGFAVFKRNPDLLFKQAPRDIFEKYHAVMKETWAAPDKRSLPKETFISDWVPPRVKKQLSTFEPAFLH